MAKADDIVILVCVTTTNHVSARMSRQMASDNMRLWWKARVNAMEGGPEAGPAREWLRHGTLAFNADQADATDGSVATAVVALEHVVGMYMTDVPYNPLQERAVQAMEKMLPIMEQEAEDHSQGEEWKNKQNEEEDE